jgi:serine/threonine-protein kinase
VNAEPSPTTNDGAPPLGALLAGEFRLVRRLGSAGMGLVFEATRASTGERVAVKLLRPAFAEDQEFAKRFEREARAVAHLSHPNIAAAREFGRTDDGVPFLVMEYVEGASLRGSIASPPTISPARALAILAQIAEALEFAHAHGTVHGDIKPENVIVQRLDDGTVRVKLIDFGVARVRGGASADDSSPTLDAIIGTPRYMPPEQALGQPLDARSDQYSLGVVAFELLCGRRPFDSDDPAALLDAHVTAPVPEVRAFRPSLPEPTNDVLRRMMAKLPDSRFASVRDAVSALTAAIESPETTAQHHAMKAGDLALRAKATVAPPAAMKRVSPLPPTKLRSDPPASTTAPHPAKRAHTTHPLVYALLLGATLLIVFALLLGRGR